jgi:hypothetical protein
MRRQSADLLGSAPSSSAGIKALRDLGFVCQVEPLAPKRIVEVNLRIGQLRAQEPLIRLLVSLTERALS